jgi:hypothetical protein
MVMPGEAIGKGHGFKSDVNWKLVEEVFNDVKRNNLLENIASCVLQKPGTLNVGVIQPQINEDNRSAFIQSSILQLMSTPEYQMC